MSECVCGDLLATFRSLLRKRFRDWPRLDSADRPPSGRGRAWRWWMLLTASADKTARIWDAETGGAVGRPMVDGDSNTRVTFRGDGNRVMTAAGEQVGAPFDHHTWVADVRYGDDGR